MTTTLTSDQITAGAAVLAIPTAILHLPCNRTMSHFATVHEMNSYKEGHRDARHAAADLVLARADELKALAAPSPQVADIAELPSIDSAEFRQNLRTYHDEASYGSLRVADNNIIAYIDGKFRDAIAASRRASTDSQEPVLKFAIEVEKMLCRALGREWSVSGISIETLIEELAARSATPAPASAGQAAPEEKPYKAGLRTGLLEGASVLREALANHVHHSGIKGLESRVKKAEQYLVEQADGRSLAAQPAEGAGQAGQVAKCWSCQKPYTANERSEADGHCPHCGVEIELDDETERAAAPADQPQIEWSNDLQGRLIDLSQDMSESEDARQVMAEAACLLAALTGHAVSQ